MSPGRSRSNHALFAIFLPVCVLSVCHQIIGQRLMESKWGSPQFFSDAGSPCRTASGVAKGAKALCPKLPQQLTHRWIASSTKQSHELCTGAVSNETSSNVLLKEELAVCSQCESSLPALTPLEAGAMPVAPHFVRVCFCWCVPACGRACMHICVHVHARVPAPNVPVHITAIMIIPSSLPLVSFLAMRRGGH